MHDNQEHLEACTSGGSVGKVEGGVHDNAGERLETRTSGGSVLLTVSGALLLAIGVLQPLIIVVFTPSLPENLLFNGSLLPTVVSELWFMALRADGWTIDALRAISMAPVVLNGLMFCVLGISAFVLRRRKWALVMLFVLSWSGLTIVLMNAIMFYAGPIPGLYAEAFGQIIYAFAVAGHIKTFIPAIMLSVGSSSALRAATGLSGAMQKASAQYAFGTDASPTASAFFNPLTGEVLSTPNRHLDPPVHHSPFGGPLTGEVLATVPPRKTDAASFGFALLGFLIPLVGLTLFVRWKGEFPLRAGSAGRGALAALVGGATIALAFIMPIHLSAPLIASL
ncbi:MAG: hypothetical protein LBG81_04965 [Coriobacteriaceae bacterium]|jgi:hypothetical protein|nr:hypothetical protein [Coriobacteriaceae bacterium]